MSSLLYALGKRCFRHWKATLALWLAAIFVLALAALGLGKGPLDVFRIPGVESFDAYTQLQHRFPEIAGANGQVLVIAKDGEKVTDPENKAYIQKVAKELESVDQTAMILDPWHEYLKTEDTITADGDAALINVQMNTTVELVADGTRDQLVEIAEHATNDRLEFHAGGGAWGPEPPVITATEMIGVVIAFVVLAVTFGSLISAGLPLVTAGIGLAFSLAIVWAATHWLTIASTGPFLALSVGMAVGIDYALFVLSRYRDELTRGVDYEEAAARAVATAGSAVVFAGATVVIALMGMVVTRIPFLILMGLCGCLALIAAVLVSLTATPALLGMLGHRLAPKPVKAAKKDKITLNERWLNVVLRFPKTAILAVTGILAFMSIPAFHLATALPDNGTAHHGTPQREAFELVGEYFGPGANSQIVLTADVVQTRDPFGFLEDVKERVLALDNVKSIPIATPNPPDGDIAVVQVTPFTGPTDPETVRLIKDLRELAPELEKDWGVDVQLTGMTVASEDIASWLTEAALPFGILVLSLSLVLLTIVFRSIAVPIKATVNFLLSTGASFGAVVWVFQDGNLAEQLHVVSVGPVVCFLPILLVALLFGLSVDYEVFLIARMREEYVHGASAEEAIRRGYVSSSKVITAAAVIMIGVFVAFFPHGDSIVQPIVFALAVGVFIDAFMVRITLLPAVMQVLGDKAWWMPKWLDKRLPVIDVEGEGVQHQLELAEWPAADAHKGVHADRIRLTDKKGAAFYGPLSFEIEPGTVMLARGLDAQARTALALTVAGRVRLTDGKLKVVDHVVPQQNMLLLPRVALIRLALEEDALAAVRASLNDRTEALVVDGLESLTEAADRDALVAEVREIAQRAGVVAFVTLSRSALEGLEITDPDIRVLDLQTSRVTPLGTPVTEGVVLAGR
ncbi:MAG TPA: MMPL family transporter [Nocardioidaceae bacterium]|nr:MMPL family transporter [Nocardioidaceae bacterium]